MAQGDYEDEEVVEASLDVLGDFNGLPPLTILKGPLTTAETRIQSSIQMEVPMAR